MSDTKSKGSVKPADAPEPTLATMIRFEAGEVGDLLAHVKEWIEWRMAGGKPAAKPDVPAVANDEASQDSPAA